MEENTKKNKNINNDEKFLYSNPNRNFNAYKEIKYNIDNHLGNFLQKI